MQLEISNLERTRAVMAEELVRLTNQNDDMEEKVKEIPKLRIQLKVNSKWGKVNVGAAKARGAVSVFKNYCTVCTFRIWSRGITPSCRCMVKKLKRQRSCDWTSKM